MATQGTHSTRRAWPLAIVGSLGVSVSACAHRRAPAASEREPVPLVGEESAVGPRASEATAAPADPDAMADSVESVAGSGVWRADGRPMWWFEGIRREGDRAAVAAEAIARDVISARRAALEQGREALRRATGEGGDERVEAMLVRRLTGDGPGRDRYVGYVKLSWRTVEKP